MKKGFTLIEILIVISIVGILASAISFGVTGHLRRARDSQRKADLAEIKKALISAKNDCRSAAYFPSVDTTSGNSKDHFDTLSNNLATGTQRYVKAKIQDLKATSPITSSTYAYEFFPNPTAGTNVLGSCAGFTGTYGTDKFLLKAKLENTGDPDATKSFSDCSGTGSVFVIGTHLDSTNNGNYFYVCVK